MKAGLWIDHRRAVVATVVGRDVNLREITFEAEALERHMGSTCNVLADDHLDRRYAHHLNHYYDEVLAAVREAESLWVMGPGLAKGEFAARLAKAGLAGRLEGTETVGKMSDRQFLAKVRARYLPKLTRRRRMRA